MTAVDSAGRRQLLPVHHHVTSRDRLRRSRHFAANRAATRMPPQLPSSGSCQRDFRILALFRGHVPLFPVQREDVTKPDGPRISRDALDTIFAFVDPRGALAER